MNEREVAELRRRFKAEKSNISHIRGCYVNEKREIISQFDQSLAMMSQGESEQLLAILRKTLSGTLNKNLLDIEFDTRQVAQGEEHKLLMTLRDSQLRSDEAVETFFQRVIQTLEMEGNYLILLAYDAYDVPYRSADGLRQDDAAADVFTYVLCSICPVKLTKEALSYFVHENQFHALAADWVVSAPETGFLFPAFDERSTNLYNALLYTRETARTYDPFVEAIFRAKSPMPAAVQQETFHSILCDTLSESCSYEVVHAVHDTLCGLIEEHKVNKVEEPLKISGPAMGQVLRNCGVEQDQAEAFEERYGEAYGAEESISPRNLVERQLELKTPDVTIKVSAGRGDLVETRIMDGGKYILIRAEDGLEVNGVPVFIS